MVGKRFGARPPIASPRWPQDLVPDEHLVSSAKLQGTGKALEIRLLTGLVWHDMLGQTFSRWTERWSHTVLDLRYSMGLIHSLPARVRMALFT